MHAPREDSPAGYYLLSLDGWFLRASDGQLAFERAPSPRQNDVEGLLVAVHARVMRLLEQRGLLEPDAADALAEQASALAACYEGAILQRVALGPLRGRPVMKLGQPLSSYLASAATRVERGGALCARLDGFNLHGQLAFGAGERAHRAAGALLRASPAGQRPAREATRWPVLAHAQDTVAGRHDASALGPDRADGTSCRADSQTAHQPRALRGRARTQRQAPRRGRALLSVRRFARPACDRDPDACGARDLGRAHARDVPTRRARLSTLWRPAAALSRPSSTRVLRVGFSSTSVSPARAPPCLPARNPPPFWPSVDEVGS